MKSLIYPLSWLLFPFTWPYQLIVRVRNKMYDTGVLSSLEYNLPVISIGNITVGGTGKTPHTEYLLELLSSTYTTAVLSRGYKRKTIGFRLVDADSTVADAGDEPLQIKRKFPQVIVAVHANRRAGIQMLCEQFPSLQLILLDDAFQHRRVKAGLSILLVDYNRKIINDLMLPVGRLREPASGKKRADIIVYTKCPPDIKPIDRRILIKETDPDPQQTVHFSYLVYGDPVPVFGNRARGLFLEQLREKNPPILLVTGIANPMPLRSFLEEHCSCLRSLEFPDHHVFSTSDMLKIVREFENLPGTGKLLITTEKDAMRMRTFEQLDEDLMQCMYYLPVRVKFIAHETGDFNQEVLSYVGNYKQNVRISSFAHQSKA